MRSRPGHSSLLSGGWVRVGGGGEEGVKGGGGSLREFFREDNFKIFFF